MLDSVSDFELWTPQCFILNIDPIFLSFEISCPQYVVVFKSWNKNRNENHVLVLLSEWLHPFQVPTRRHLTKPKRPLTFPLS
jgi:hypothetical protein